MTGYDLSYVVRALEIMCEPNTSNEQRTEGFQIMEEFKNNNFHLEQLPLLCSSNQHINVKIFGIQCLEHMIKHKWLKMQVDEKYQIKNAIFQIGLSSFIAGSGHNDGGVFQIAVSKIFVHLIKCEWPQQWPDMIKELMNLASAGISQRKLVLSIFLRLSQDVVHFQDVPVQRKKDIIVGLNENIEDIINFALQTVMEHAEASGNQTCVGEEHLSVCREAVNMLTGYLDWVKLDYVCGKGGAPIALLTGLLALPQLRLSAAEALLVTLNRKGKMEDLEPLCLLWERDDVFARITAAVSELFLDPSTLLVYVESRYELSRRLIEILVRMGIIMAGVWETRYSKTLPPNWASYVECLRRFTHHPVKMICIETFDAWNAFFSLRPPFRNVSKEVASSVLLACRNSAPKSGFPNEKTPAGLFSRHLFEYDDYVVFNGYFRVCLLKCVKAICNTYPDLTFEAVLEWLRFVSSLQISQQDLDSDGVVSEGSSIALEWDAVCCTCDCVVSALQRGLDSDEKVALRTRYPAGCDTAMALVQLDCQDPVIVQHVLYCLVIFFPFADGNQELVAACVNRVMRLLYFDLPGQNKHNRAKSVRVCRTQAGSYLVRIARLHGHLLTPVFSPIFESIKQLWSNENLTVLEKCMLLECVVILSSQLKNFEQERTLLSDILGPIMATWTGPTFEAALTSPQSFASWIGLDQAPPSDDNQSGDVGAGNRLILSTCVRALLSTINKSRVPTDMEELRRGGFVVQEIRGRDHIRHPAGAILLPLLPYVFRLVRVFNAVWNPEFVSSIHPDYVASFQLTMHDKLAVLGRTLPQGGSSSSGETVWKPIHRMRNFLRETSDFTMQLLGHAFDLLGYDLYGLGELPGHILSFPLAGVESLPDLRLHIVNKYFVQSFIKNCPADCMETCLVPVLVPFFGVIFSRLKSRWETITVTREEDQDSEVSDEVVAEQIVRLFTRTTMEMIRCVLTFNGKTESNVGGASQVTNGGDTTDLEEHDDMEDVEMSAPGASKGHTSGRKLGALALILTSGKGEGGLALLAGLVEAMSWPDSIACLRATEWILPLLFQLVESCPSGVSCEVVTHVLLGVLRGLRVNGEHTEATLTTLVSTGARLYDRFREDQPGLTQVLQVATGQSSEVIQSFDSKLTAKKVLSDKQKRDAFKKIVSPVVGVSLSERYREEIHFRHLPPLMKETWKRRESVLDDDLSGHPDIAGLTALFGTHD